MGLERLSSIITPSSLIEAGVPTASIAVLSGTSVSTRVITSGAEDRDTLYQACSISKAITALAVAKLIDLGYLQYSTKVSDHLPQDIADLIVHEKTKHIYQHVTVGHLLSHTSGLSNHGFPGYDMRDAIPTTSDVLAGRVPANTARVHFTTFPGAQYSYSGGGFVVLQLFLEALLAKPFHSIMNETVLEPLDMTRSFFGPLPEDERNYSVPYLTGHLKAPSGPFQFVELAAAGLWTTPSDLLKAITAIESSLASLQGGYLKNETAEQMLQPVQIVSGVTSMAYGWFVTDTAFGHTGGNDPGFCCYAMGFRPRPANANLDVHSKSKELPQGRALAVMTNGPYSNKSIWSVVSAIFYLQDWPRLSALPSDLASGVWRAVIAPEGTTVPESWEDWLGQWKDGWTIIKVDNKPAIRFHDHPEMPLLVAAAPVDHMGDAGAVVALVIDGLEVQVVLTWDKDEQVVELLQREKKVLRRVSSSS